MKRIFALVAVGVVVIAYLIGYWPQRQRAVALEQEVATLRAQVADLEARKRAAELLGELLNVIDAVTRNDYGQAQQLSSTFFDHVRAETNSPIPSLQVGLSSILAQRDAITSALARADVQVLGRLLQLQVQLRAALGFPTPPGRPS